MNTGQNRIFDELAKLMTDAAGAAQGVRREVESAFRAQAERMIASMDLVQREEFDAVREMAGVSSAMPVVYMWCAHTTKPIPPIATMA